MRDILLVVGVPIVVLLLIFGTFYVYDLLKRQFQLRKKERQLSRLLAGRNLDELLKASPYDYAHFQGEDGYRMFDTRTKDGFVGFVYTRLEAHIWIVERFIKEGIDASL